MVKEVYYKYYVEYMGGLEVIEKCIKKGFGDVNLGVREKVCVMFWKFNVIWFVRVEVIMDGFDVIV